MNADPVIRVRIVRVRNLRLQRAKDRVCVAAIRAVLQPDAMTSHELRRAVMALRRFKP